MGPKLSAFVLLAIVVGGAAGLGSELLAAHGNQTTPLNCPQGASCQVFPPVLFLTGYNATAGGLSFIIQNSGAYPETIDRAYANSTKVSFVISPASAVSYCDSTAEDMNPADRCLVAISYPGLASGEIIVRLVLSNGATVSTDLQPGGQLRIWNSTTSSQPRS